MEGFFDGLLGHWYLTGEVLGRPIEQEVFVDETLDRRFLRIHYLPSTVTPIGDEPYEALAIVGRDGDGYVMSLFDRFTPGAGPTGRGIVAGDAVTFTFDYAEGPFLTAVRRIPDGWDIEQTRIVDGEPIPFGIKRIRRPRMHKVWAYITDGPRLLLLRHADQPLTLSGLQVPSGTLDEGEDPAAGVLREAAEETGRTDLEIIRALGESRLRWGYSDSDVSAFHLRFTGEVPDRLEHGEFMNPDTFRFTFFWLDVRDAQTLLWEQQQTFIPELMRALGLEVQ